MSPRRAVGRVVPCTQLIRSSRREVGTPSMLAETLLFAIEKLCALVEAYSPMIVWDRADVVLGITVSSRRASEPRLRLLSTTWKRSPRASSSDLAVGVSVDGSHSQRCRSSTPAQGCPPPVTLKP